MKRARSNGGFITWPNSIPGASLDQFLALLIPSSDQPPTGVSWYCVEGPRPGSPGKHGALDAGHAILARLTRELAAVDAGQGAVRTKQERRRQARAQAIDDMLAAGVAAGDTSGKWCLFRSHDLIDAAWEKVARATAAGTLGHAAKVRAFNKWTSYERYGFILDGRSSFVRHVEAWPQLH